MVHRFVLGGRDWFWQGRSGEFAFRMDEIEYDRLAIQLPGLPQVENAATSIAAVLQAGLGGAPDAEIAIRSGLARTTLPGRFEVIEHQGRQIVLDGAHTLASTELLVEALEEAGIADPVVVAGFLSDKDMAGMATKLALVADRLILTAVDSPRSATLEELTGISSEITGETVGVFPALEIAMGVALETAGPRQPIVVTGSMKLVAQAREWLCLVGKK